MFPDRRGFHVRSVVVFWRCPKMADMHTRPRETLFCISVRLRIGGATIEQGAQGRGKVLSASPLSGRISQEAALLDSLGL